MRSLVIFLLVLLLMGCQESGSSLADPRTTKEIIVVTHSGPSTYYYSGNNQYAGLEYDLVRSFVRELGPEYSVKFLIVQNISQVIPALRKHKAHFAAADLSVTAARERMVKFTQPYQSVQQRIIYNTDRTRAPSSIKDLLNKHITVSSGTSYAESLRRLKGKEPQLHWSETSHANSDELMTQVAEGKLDFTIADNHLIALIQNYYPNLAASDLPLEVPEQIAWAFAKTGDPWLYEQANAFFARIRKDGTLRNLIDRYYGHTDRLKPVDVTTFIQRSETLLPQYKRMFHDAQELTGLDWRLIAAISYQESHWDRFNTSPTNVRGMMMLTEETADRLGVTDRLDARQSITAGARYIVMLKDSIPESVAEPDRTWLALAAYNIGYAHLLDARTLATRLKLNPDRWVDVKKTLPLLSKDEYYSTLKFGFARGGAPVVFVESVRTYYKILALREPRHNPVFPSFELTDFNGFNNSLSQE